MSPSSTPGLGKIAQKVGEEATETVIAALSGSADELTGEAADLLFHLLVLLGARRAAGRRAGGTGPARRRFRHRRKGQPPNG
jgi:hypothetical protein